jgi:hypothetical protein
MAFYEGGTQLASIALQNGAASYATTSLAEGTHQLTAVYISNGNFTSATSSTVTVTIQPATVSISTPGSGTGSFTISLPQGSTGAGQFTLAPQGTLTGTLVFSCTGLPPGLACTFSPPSINASALPAAISLSIASGSTTASSTTPHIGLRNPWELGWALPAPLLPFGWRKWRRHSWLCVAIVSLALLSLVSCGGASNPGTNTGASSPSLTPKGAYSGTLVISNAGATVASSTFTIVVQ